MITIFDQGSGGDCKDWSFVTALLIMDPSIDIDKVILAINENPAGLLTNRAAGEFFKNRGFISGYESVPRLKVKALLNRGIPLIATITGVDWDITGKPPYRAVFKEGKIGAHSICVVDYDQSTRLLKIANTWGPAWGDNGFYYLHADDLTRVTEFCQIFPI